VVPVTADPKIGWRVPADEVEQFNVFVREKSGETEGWLGREIRRAMREWIDADEFAAVEQVADRLVRAAGRTPEALAEKKRRRDHPASEDTELVQCRAPRELQEAFAASAREQDEYPGVHLARALRERRTNSRAQRVRTKLGRVVDDAEAVLAEMDPEGEGEKSITHLRTLSICSELGEQFTEDELEATIAKIAGDSPPTLRSYRERVLKHRNNVEHPNAPNLFVHEDTAREIAEKADAPGPDAPAFDRKDYSNLTREEKVHGLRVALARRAAQNDGRVQLDATAVRTKVFESEPSDSHARTLMRRAGLSDGFEFGKRHGKDRLRVSLRDVTDGELEGAIGAAGTNREDVETDVPPGAEAEENDEEDPGKSVKSQMDRLTAAERVQSDPMEDGGSSR
jgi:hypothetical protein